MSHTPQHINTAPSYSSYTAAKTTFLSEKAAKGMSHPDTVAARAAMDAAFNTCMSELNLKMKKGRLD